MVELKKQLCAVCKQLAESGVVSADALLSIKDGAAGVYAFNNPQVALAAMTEADVVLVNAEGCVVDGKGTVSPYFAVHKALYDGCAGITAVVQPNGRWSSIWAQTGRMLPPTSFLHARHFKGEIPCTGSVTAEDGEDIYANVAAGVCNTFRYKGIGERGAVFMRNDGVLVWGKDPVATAKRAVVMEELCFRAMQVAAVTQGADSYVAHEVSEALLEQE